MEELMEMLEIIEDRRQQSKVRYTIKEVVLIVFCCTLSNVDDWEDMEIWANHYIKLLREYLPYENGIPSHDTIQRVMGMIDPDYIQQAYNKWTSMLEKGEKEKLKKVIAIDGKTMRGNKQNNSKPNHIVTAWSREGGYSLGQQTINEKSNEIKAIPKLLDKINIKNSVVTIDAMGTQTAIAEKIKNQKGDYVLAVKENQKILFEEISLYFEDADHLKKIKDKENYRRTAEKNHGSADVREYYQTNSISWLNGREKWKGIKSIGMVIRTYKGVSQKRYYISSLNPDIKLFSNAVRGHWSVESMHWQLDVTFKEDSNHTLNKTAAENQNIICKWCLPALKQAIFMNGKVKSMRQKRMVISFSPIKYLDYVLSL
jgi:transposase DDE domain